MSNKTSIGIRATPSKIFYAIIEEGQETFKVRIVDILIVPAALTYPEQLKFIRNTFLDIIREFSIQVACIRVTEPSSFAPPNLARVGIEAVIQELIASSTVTRYFTGQISSISSRLGFTRDNFKPLASGEAIFYEIEGWTGFSSEHREAILASFSALKN